MDIFMDTNQEYNGLLSLQEVTLTLYKITPVYTFSILFSLHLLFYWQGKFIEKTRASFAVMFGLAVTRKEKIWF